MKPQPFPFIVSLLAVAAIGRAAEAPPTIPLRAAADGPQIALLQAAANPYKPYIAQLFAPGEKPLPLLDDSPPDHFHHHGLMFGIGVDGADFWAEKGFPNAGRQEPAATKLTKDGNGFDQTLKWLAADGTHLLDETRRVRVRTTMLPNAAGAAADTVNWLDWTSVIAPAAGRESVRLKGSHYFGLGMRFLPAWKDHTTFVWAGTAGQKVVRGDERITPGPWGAAQCEVDGRPVTVLMVDHPDNTRAARWFTMGTPFSYLSAALGLDTEPATLAKDQRWTLRYGVAVLAGKPDAAALEKLAKDWQSSAPPPPTPNQP